MLAPREDESIAIGPLIQRATDDVRELVSAEIDLGKRKLMARVAGARNGIILLVAAIFLLQAALTTLLVGFALGLERWVGPLGGAAIVFSVTLAVIGILAKIGVGQLAGPAATPTGQKPS